MSWALSRVCEVGIFILYTRTEVRKTSSSEHESRDKTFFWGGALRCSRLEANTAGGGRADYSEDKITWPGIQPRSKNCGEPRRIPVLRNRVPRARGLAPRAQILKRGPRATGRGTTGDPREARGERRDRVQRRRRLYAATHDRKETSTTADKPPGPAQLIF